MDGFKTTIYYILTYVNCQVLDDAELCSSMHEALSRHGCQMCKLQKIRYLMI